VGDQKQAPGRKAVFLGRLSTPTLTQKVANGRNAEDYKRIDKKKKPQNHRGNSEGGGSSRKKKKKPRKLRGGSMLQAKKSRSLTREK